MVSKCVLAAAPRSVEPGEEWRALWSLRKSKRNLTFPHELGENCGGLPSGAPRCMVRGFVGLPPALCTHDELN
jgi:hypothetical protein